MIQAGMLRTRRLWGVPLRLRRQMGVGKPARSSVGIIEPRVSLTISVRRDGAPSSDFLVTLQGGDSGQALAYFNQYSPSVQWFKRSAIYREVIATAYEYTEPRMGITRWPTISETANTFLFNVTEGSGGGGPSTVDASIQFGAAVESQWKPREAVVVERMDDGQWRVAGAGRTAVDGFSVLDLKVTTSGTIYALGLDDYGTTFVPGSSVAVGDRVRPSVFTGWVYEITEPGQLPLGEPQWWAAQGENPSRPLGTARAIAVRYYLPQAFGPLPVEIT